MLDGHRHEALGSGWGWAMRNDLRAPAASKFFICEFGISRKAFQGLTQSLNLNVEADG